MMGESVNFEKDNNKLIICPFNYIYFLNQYLLKSYNYVKICFVILKVFF